MLDLDLINSINQVTSLMEGKTATVVAYNGSWRVRYGTVANEFVDLHQRDFITESGYEKSRHPVWEISHKDEKGNENTTHICAPSGSEAKEIFSKANKNHKIKSISATGKTGLDEQISPEKGMVGTLKTINGQLKLVLGATAKQHIDKLHEDSSPLDKSVLTPEELAKKHGVELSNIEAQLKMGIEVEKEHTSDEKAARQIALAHLGELPDYYTKLKKVEKPQLTKEGIDPAKMDKWMKMQKQHHQQSDWYVKQEEKKKAEQQSKQTIKESVQALSPWTQAFRKLQEEELNEEDLDESAGHTMKLNAAKLKREGDLAGHHREMQRYHEHMADAMDFNSKGARSASDMMKYRRQSQQHEEKAKFHRNEGNKHN